MTFEEWFDSLPEDELKTYGMADAFNAGLEIGAEELHTQLYQERQDHAKNIADLKELASNVIKQKAIWPYK